MATTAIQVRPGPRPAPPPRQAVQYGLIGGVFALLLALVGMVEAFSRRDIIGGVISSGQAMLWVTVLTTAYLTVSRIARQFRGIRREALLAYGALAGLMASGVLALFLLIGTQVNLRDVLVNASPPLYDLFSFDQPPALGALYQLGLGTLLGLLGALIFVVPNRISDALLLGFTIMVLVGLLQDITRLIVSTGISREAERWLFASSGLTVPGALLLFSVPFLLKLGWSYYGDEVRAYYLTLSPQARQVLRWVGIVLALAAVLYFPQFFGRFPAEVMNNVALLGIMMGLGLNIVVGFAGLLDLGYVGFFAIGAYTMALLTSSEIGLTGFTFWTALPFAVLVSIIAGVILGIPVLKMRGDYLAIVTLGFGEIIRILFLSNWLQPYVGGARGIVGVPNPSVIGVGPLNNPEELYYLLVVSVALAWFISARLRDSRLGRAWMAIREDEDVAEAMGIDLVTTKLLAFGTGAAMAGFGGAIFAAKLQSIVPQTFDLLISVNALSVIIIGGLASIPGVIVGALLLIGLPELLREFAEYRLWVYGALLVVMMLNRPEGFVPEPTRRRELHSHDNPELTDDHTIASDLTKPSGPTDASMRQETIATRE